MIKEDEDDSSSPSVSDEPTIFKKRIFGRDITSYIFSIITIIYFLIRINVKRMNGTDFGLYIIFTFILSLAPLSQPFQSKNPSFYIYLNGAIVLAFILAQESITAKYLDDPDFSVYLGLVILYRSLSYHTVIDNFAIVIAYFADSTTLYYDSKEKRIDSLLYVGGVFVFALSATNVIKRIKFRIREHISVLLVLLERHKREIEQTKSMLRTSIPSELLNENFDDEIKNETDADISITEDSIKNEAIQRNIIPQYKEAKINIKDLTSMQMKKKLSVIIGFRHIGEENDCYVSSLRLNKVHYLLDLVGSMHKISCVHRFGDKWLGCIGFFEDSWGAASNDCYHAILAAIQVLQLAEKSQGKLCAAIDCGYVVGGFVGQPSFDLFGAEVRWVLDTIDYNRAGEILVSNTVKSKVSRDIHIGQNDSEKEIQFTRTTVAGRDNGEKVFIVGTELNYLNNEELRKIKSEIDKHYLNDFYQTDCEAETIETIKPSFSNSYIAALNRFLLTLNTLINSWESSLSPEFKSNTFERFGISMNDPILKELGSKLMKQMTEKIESELEDLIANTFLSKLNFTLLRVPDFLKKQVSDEIPSVVQEQAVRMDNEALNPLTILLETWFGKCFSYLFNRNFKSKYTLTADDESQEYTDLLEKLKSTNTNENDKSNKNSYLDSYRPILHNWLQYNSDARLISHRSISYFLINYTLMGCSLGFTLNNLETDNNGIINAVFLGLHILTVIILLMFERNYDSYVYVAASIFSYALLVLLPFCLFDNSSYSQSRALSINFVLYAIELRTDIVLVLVNKGLMCLFFIIYLSSTNRNLYNESITVVFMINFLFRFLYMWIIQYRTYVAYVLEYILMPEAIKTSNKQKEYKIKAYQECYPHISDIFFAENSSTRARLHRNVSIIAIHVKASDILPALLHQHQLGVFLQKVLSIINSCIAESGLVKMSQFCGLTIAAACDDFQTNNLQAQAPIGYVTKCFVFLRNLQKRLDEFDHNYNFNVAVGVGLSHGPMTTGTFFGNYGNSFVLSEDVRIQSHQMAFCKQKGFYASMAFESEIAKGKLFDDINIRKVKMTINDRSEDWISLGRSYSGMGIDDFEPKNVIGKGGYGTVILCVDKETGVQYAVKVITRKLTTTQDHNLIQRELFILQKIKHANVVNFKFCLIKEPKIYLVMTLINGGNLKQVLDKDLSIGIDQLKIWFAELVLAIEYIHSMRIIHRDVKPSNCMIDEEGHLQLGDFGLSKIISEPVLEKVEVNNNTNDLNDDSVKMLQKLLFLKPFSNERQISKESKFQILLVESSYNSKLSIDLMESLFDVIVVTSVNEALDLKNKNRRYDFDIILVNLNISKDSDDKRTSSNIQTLKDIRALDAFNHMPVIALTQTDDILIQQICMGIRATDCLLLPWQVSYRDIVVKHCRYFRLIKGPSSRDSSKSPSMYPLNLSLSTESIMETPTPKESDSIISVATPISTQVNQMFQSQLQMAKSQEAQQHSAVGTINFMAPEVVADRKYGKAVDWWAVGVTFYECATRTRLFNGNDKNAVFELILNQRIDLSPIQTISPSLATIVNRLLERDPLTRMGTDGSSEIKSADFFKDTNWDTVSTSETAYKPEPLVMGDTEKSVKYARQVYYGADQPFYKKFNQLNSSNRLSSRERRRDRYRRKGSIGSHVKTWISGEHTSDRRKSIQEWSGTSGVLNSRRNDSMNYTIEEKESEGSSTSRSSRSRSSTLLKSEELI